MKCGKTKAELERSSPPVETCLRCPAVLSAHPAYIRKTKRWEWRTGSVLCYRCRRDNGPAPREHRVYAVWFPGVKMLKIGHTQQPNDTALLSVKNHAANRKDGKLIWTGHGGLPEESFIQAYFQLRGYAPWKDSEQRTRLSEWLSCPDDTAGTLKDKLNSVYAYVNLIKDAEL